MIQVLQPSPTGAELQAVQEVLASRWWGNGPVCREFERELAARYAYEADHYQHCVTVNSATAALHLALLSHGIGPGDEVIVPALTFVSTALAVVYCGAKPIFADVRADTLTLNWEELYRLLGPRTKAMIPVDYAGYPADNPGEHHPKGVAVVQDAAHSCGGAGYGDSVCLSFHPVKNCASPDGGAILLNDGERAERLRALRWCGIDRSTWERSGKRYSWDYEIREIGYKCHWNDVAAAIALQQLRRLDQHNRRRREIAERYSAELPAWVERPADHPQHTWHLYAARVPAERRDQLIDYLAERGIGTSVHYKPLTYYAPFADQATPSVTEREWRRLISLPIHPDLTDEEQGRVIEAVRGFSA